MALFTTLQTDQLPVCASKALISLQLKGDLFVFEWPLFALDDNQDKIRQLVLRDVLVSLII